MSGMEVEGGRKRREEKGRGGEGLKAEDRWIDRYICVKV